MVRFLTMISLLSALLMMPLTDKAQKPEETCPLTEGSTIPDVSLTSMDGEEVQVSSLVTEQPTLLVFYRGGWCPYCNKHLKSITNVEEELRDMGYQIIAVSPDKPSKLGQTMDKHNMNYQLYSDNDMAVSKAFGLGFDVSEETLAKYDEHGIDLKEASGKDHQMLPVPAVYITDEEGTIRFAHANQNYKNRLDADVMKAVAGALLEQTK